MKTKKFLEIDRRFNIAGFLTPHIGGPYGYVSHLIPRAETEQDYWRRVAGRVSHIAIHSDFSTLDLKKTSAWKLNQKTKDLLVECEVDFDYLRTTCLVPNFVGDGVIYTLIGEERILNTDSWQTSTWSPTDTETSIEDLLNMIGGFFQARLVRREISGWRLRYILRTTWEGKDPELKGYGIFVPPDQWIKENASFEKGVCRTR